MKKYLWVILFFVTTLCFAQPSAAINQANTDNNLVIQLVDSKLVGLDSKITMIAQSNQDGIADLKARTDEKLADKFKQLDDKGVYVGWWLNVLGIWLTIIGILAPFGAIWLNHKINKNIKDSQELLDKEIKNVTDQVKNKLLESDRLLTEMRGFHRNAEISASEIQNLANKVNLGSLTPEDSQKLENDSNDLKNIPEGQLTANDWFIRGLNAHSQQDYHAAITYFNKAIKLNNNEVLNSQIYSNRGVAKFKLGLYHEAIKDYDKAIQLDDKNYPAYFNRAIANRMLENNELALKDYDKAIELNPHKPDTYNNRGVVKLYLGDYTGAKLDFNQVIKLDGSDADGYNNRGLVNFKLEDYANALSDFDKAIMLNPNKPDAYINRGVVKSKLEQNEEAISDFDRAIRINPSNIEFYNNRGVTLIKLQRYDDAIKDYDKAIELDPKNVTAYFNKACAYALMKNKNEALKWLEKALQLGYLVNEALKDEDWKIYLNDADFKNLRTKYYK